MENTELKILMENISAKQSKIDLQQDTINRRLDTHESLINEIRIELSKNSQQQQVLIDSTSETKNSITETIEKVLSLKLPQYLQNGIRKELDIMLQNNPKKIIQRNIGIIETIKNYFIKK